MPRQGLCAGAAAQRLPLRHRTRRMPGWTGGIFALLPPASPAEPACAPARQRKCTHAARVARAHAHTAPGSRPRPRRPQNGSRGRCRRGTPSRSALTRRSCCRSTKNTKNTRCSGCADARAGLASGACTAAGSTNNSGGVASGCVRACRCAAARLLWRRGDGDGALGGLHRAQPRRAGRRAAARVSTTHASHACLHSIAAHAPRGHSSNPPGTDRTRAACRAAADPPRARRSALCPGAPLPRAAQCRSCSLCSR
jgi:hypothetical protein